MIKNYFQTIIALTFLFFIFSCDNTTSDPISYNTGNSGGNPGSGTNPGTGTNPGGSTITGPRILHKVTNNNSEDEEYVSSGGVLTQSRLRDASSTTPNFLVSNITNENSKITKIKSYPTSDPNFITNDITFAYDSSGKVILATNNRLEIFLQVNSSYSFTYSGDKLTKIVEKFGANNNYTHHNEKTLTYTNGNVTKIEMKSMLVDNGVPDPSTLNLVIYRFEEYDTAKNPYGTLPKTYLIYNIMTHPGLAFQLSSNNFRKLTVEQMGVVIPTPSSGFIYDSENYPTSNQTQNRKFIYKPL